jgi:hypothetical protein
MMYLHLVFANLVLPSQGLPWRARGCLLRPKVGAINRSREGVLLHVGFDRHPEITNYIMIADKNFGSRIVLDSFPTHFGVSLQLLSIALSRFKRGFYDNRLNFVAGVLHAI